MAHARFQPIRPNPYIVGNPVRDRSMFFGREVEFQLVLNRFGESSQGGIIVFCGERRSGKTSILFRILDGRLGPGFLPVLIDMQSMVVENESDFYRKIISEIVAVLEARGVHLEAQEGPPADVTPMMFQDFIADLYRRCPDRKPILLVDEYELLETKIAAGVLTANVLDVFAALLQRHPFFLVFTGSDRLEERSMSYWRILGQSIHKRISYLEESDALELITKPLAGLATYAPGVVQAIYRLGAGHPFYTQALCQSIVDQLNEQHSTEITEDLLATVVEMIVNNPFPQMIFLWAGLPPEEKLALALLAEALTGEATFAGPEDLHRLHREKKYPGTFGSDRIEAALEELFRKEVLIKHSGGRRGYAYRMDLWRRWILVKHSVWQVLREEDLPRDNGRRKHRRAIALTVSTAALLALFVLRTQIFQPPTPQPTSYTLSLDPVPRDASVYQGDQLLGTGPVLPRLPAHVEHHFAIRAPGYADSSFSVSLRADERREVVLRPLTGALAVTTDPPAALVTVDGVARGPSPVVVTELAATREHTVRAELAGFILREGPQRVAPDTTTGCHLILDALRFPVTFTTSPSAALITLDGNPHGRSPTTVEELKRGTYRVSAQLDGYQTVDSVAVLTEATRVFLLNLRATPPGELVVRGQHRLARRIYVDSERVASEVYNSGALSLAPGVHQIEVVVGDSSLVRELEVVSGQRTVYDYDKDGVQREPGSGTP